MLEMAVKEFGMALVSIIIPVYNVEEYLGECLDSVLNQTLEDIELICIDDGSSDSSLKILKEYSDKDKRIVVVTQQNMGVGKTRNKGIELANGEYVCFMDPDDIYPSNDVLEVLYNNAKANNVTICGGEFADFLDGTDFLKQNYKESLCGYLFDKDGIVQYEDYQFDYGYHRFLYNKEFLKEHNLFFPAYKRFQDPPFFVKALYEAKEFFAVDKMVYGYRYGHNKINWTEEKVNDFLMALWDNFEFAQAKNLDRLLDYSCIRFKEHYPHIRHAFNKTSRDYIKKFIKVKPEIRMFIFKYNLKTFISNVFSIKNSPDKIHKVVTVCGLRIKFKKGKK